MYGIEIDDDKRVLAIIAGVWVGNFMNSKTSKSLIAFNKTDLKNSGVVSAKDILKNKVTGQPLLQR